MDLPGARKQDEENEDEEPWGELGRKKLDHPTAFPSEFINTTKSLTD